MRYKFIHHSNRNYSLSHPQRVKETGETQRKPLTVSPVNKCHIQKEKKSYNVAEIQTHETQFCHGDKF